MVTLNGGGFTSPATATAVVVNGVVTQIIVTGGSGYQTAPSVTIATPIQAGALSISYASPATTGTLTYTPVPHAFGTATITVTVTDNGGTAGGGQNTTVQTFLVTVNPINQAPTINPIVPPAAILENTSGLQSVSLSGITAGAGESQVLTVAAASSNPGLISNPLVSYTSPNTVGTLTYSVVPNASGTAVISVTVMDNGPTPGANPLNINAVTQTFTVTVTPVNQAPTLNAIPNPPAVTVNGPQTIQLTGISTGPGDSGQNIVSVSATVNTASATATLNGDTVGSIAVNYGGAGYASPPLVTLTGGGFTTPAAATAILDGNGVVTGFMITSPGSGYTSAPLVTIASPATALIPTSGPNAPVTSYANPSSTGTVTYTPVAGQSGTAVITVTVTDNGGTANGGVNSVSQSFIVAVSPPNVAPVVATTGTALAYLQGQGTAFIDPGLTLQDNNTPPNSNIVGATIQITGNYNPGQDVLSFNPQNGITATSYNVATGTLTLSGPAQISVYQNALRSVTYFNNSTNPAPLTRQVTFTVDDGATVNNLGSASRSILITPVNIAPTLNPIPNPAPLLENSGLQTINLSGITAGGGQAQSFPSFVATSSNTGLIPNPTVSYTSPNTSGSLSFTPVPNTFGTATITVVFTDSGGVANGGVASVVQTFTVTVLPVNQIPTLAALNPVTILENNFTPQAIGLATITDGTNETGQNLTVSAVSSNPSLIPNPSINYTSPAQTGTLTFSPLPNVSGQAIILVTVMDDGGTANGGINSLTRSFTITVTPVNQAPTINPIQDPQPVFENSITALSPATIPLSGITDGPGDTGQVLTVSAVSSNTALVLNPSVVYTNPNTTGTLLYSLAPNASGKATITVTVTDNGSNTSPNVNSFSETFNVVVLPINQAPTLGPIATPGPILENSAGVTISLSGITAGQGDTQNLAIVITNLTPSIIATPTVSYISPRATGTLTIVPQTFATGTAMFEVSVVDDGGTANGGVNISAPQIVTVSVVPVNQQPNINSISTITLPENSGPATATASIAGGVVSGINLTFNGSPFYQAAPTVTIAPPTSGGTQATAIATVANGLISGIQITNPGSGYTTAPAVTIGPLNIALTGINPGTGDLGQVILGVAATSSNTALIPRPSITYPNVNPTTGATDLTSGILNYTPVANASGTALITLTVTDNGGTANGGKNTFTETFSITVSPVNQAPTLNPISPNPLVLPLSPGPQTVGLNGISDGQNNPPTSLTVTVSSSNPAVIPNPLVTATATATLSGGSLGSTLNITNGGAGYTFAPAVTIAPPPSGGTQATATATVANGVVTAITVSGGSGYIAVPAVTIAPPFATATGLATLNGGSFAITVTNGGAGYSSLNPPQVTLNGGTFTSPATATAVVTNGVVTSIMVNGGMGYTAVPTVVIAPPLAAATATATLNGGSVGTITPTYGGSGYINPPQVLLVGGGNFTTPATASAVLTNGAVTGFTFSGVNSIAVTGGGSGYSSQPADGHNLGRQRQRCEGDRRGE